MGWGGVPIGLLRKTAHKNGNSCLTAVEVVSSMQTNACTELVSRQRIDARGMTHLPNSVYFIPRQ